MTERFSRNSLIYLDKRNNTDDNSYASYYIAAMAFFPYSLARPFLHLFEPEDAHWLALKALKFGLIGSGDAVDDPVLTQSLWGLSFPNPLGLAAGFDKEAEVPDAMLKLGFGFVEVGTVTPKPQLGNPRPRLFRLNEDEAAINRFGFNSGGLEPYAARLEARHGRPGIVGANVGKNKYTEKAEVDYIAGIERVCAFCDYIVVNISSPNTEGLRALQARQNLEALLSASMGARARCAPNLDKLPPLLVKVAPDLDLGEMQDIAEVVVASGIDGLIIGNTTIDRPTGLKSDEKSQAGGLSGRPLMEKSTDCLAGFYRLTKGKIPLIGCGGVSSGGDAYAKIRAGASLVQVYTALVFHGPLLVGRINQELTALLKADGFESVTAAIGADRR
jgi:dihydroorotate dehydrogenase